MESNRVNCATRRLSGTARGSQIESINLAESRDVRSEESFGCEEARNRIKRNDPEMVCNRQAGKQQQIESSKNIFRIIFS
jgi:hypothetical protein